MQRRAVALYVVVFLLVIAAAGAMIATAEEPEISIEDPDYNVVQGEPFEVDGVTYTIVDLTEGDEAADFEASIEWNETDVEQSDTWDNETTIEYRNVEWAVELDGGEEPAGLTIEEIIDREAILEADPNAQNQTTQDADGNEFVVVIEDGERQFVPAEEYFPEPETERLVAGDTIALDDDRTVTVETIEAGGATVTWVEDVVTRSQTVRQGGTVELGDDEYLAWFTGVGTVSFTTDFEAYDQQVETVERFDDRVTGLWYVIITSGMIVFLLPMVAFLPSRY